MAEKMTLNVKGMSCGHCVARVERALNDIEGVSDVAVSLEAEVAAVEFDPAMTGLDDFKTAVADAGYEVV